MRGVLGGWLQERGVASGLPDRPLVVFEEGPDGPGSIDIRILDQDGFVPLAERLGWINANLRLVDALGVERLIKAMAEDASRTDLAKTVGRDRKKAEARLRQASDDLEARTYAELSDLAERLTTEISAAAVRTGHVFAKIDRMYSEFLMVNDILREMSIVDTPITERLSRLKQTGAEILAGLDVISHAIGVAEPRMRQLEGDVEKLFTRLAESQAQLLDTLNGKK